MKVFDGAKLKKMRLDAKLTQYDLAPLTNIAQTRISDIERNVRRPSPDEIDAFMTVFRTAKTDFLSDEKEIIVISGTFTKNKKENLDINSSQDSQSEPTFTGIVFDKSSVQLELFPNDKVPLGVDLVGYVILTKEVYAELIKSQEKLHKLQNLLK